jgi:hypothetical protein
MMFSPVMNVFFGPAAISTHSAISSGSAPRPRGFAFASSSRNPDARALGRHSSGRDGIHQDAVFGREVRKGPS